MNAPSSLSVRVARKAVEAHDICTFELVAVDGRPLPPARPLVAALTGAATGLAAGLRGGLRLAPVWRTALFLGVLGAGALAAFFVAGLCGAALAAVAAFAVLSLLDPDWTV